MDEKKIIGKNALAYYDSLLKNLLNNKVEKETGKGLSTNDLTDELKEKILKAGESSFSGAYADLSGKPAIDGNELSAKSTAESLGLAKSTDIPTDYLTEADLKGYAKTSELPDVSKFQTAEQVEETLSGKNYATETFVTDKGYQTASDVSSSIESATTDMATQTWVNSQIANLNKKEVVTSTEQMTDENTIYLLSNEGVGNNIYDEYIVVSGKPEKIGTTEVDLSGYVKSADLTEITNEEIDAIVNG